MTEARKRYYDVSPDMVRNPSDLEWLNQDEALRGVNPNGRLETRVPDYRHPVHVGLPAFQVRPRIKVGVRNQPLDIYGFDRLFISSRAKALLERIDDEAFEFASCETSSRRGLEVEPYWFVRVVRIVGRFDEARSNFVTYAQMWPDAPDAATNAAVVRLNDIRMPEDFPDRFHAFYLGRYRRHFIFDEVIVDAWRGAGLTGAFFTPLQAPRKAELKRRGSFTNYPFWETRSG